MKKEKIKLTKNIAYTLFTIGLVFLVIGISYAAYTFTGTGTKENVITTGQIQIAFAEQNNIKLQNRYPETDAVGIASTDANSSMTFTVSGNISGDAVVNYAIGLTNITEGSTLTQDYIKIYLTKNGSVSSGFSEGSGKTIGSFETSKVTGYLDSHAIAQGSITGTQVDTYVLKAWIDENYDLPTTDTSLGKVHSAPTTTETFSFKIKVVGTDSALEIEDPLKCDEMPEETSNANSPSVSLASNMMPVCYNSENDVWLKADSSNTNTDYQWYSYSGKQWANAVTVNKNAIGTTKNNQSVNVSNAVVSKPYYKSTNGGVNSSTSSSIFTFTAGSSGSYSFSWSVSSESGYDKLTIKVNGTTLTDVNAVSGVKLGTYTGTATSGTTYTIEASYTKDSSGNENDDVATIGNFVLPSGSTSITHQANSSYPNYQWESHTKSYYSLTLYNYYTLENDKFVLSDGINEGNLIGKYICSDGTSTICDEIYEIVEYNNATITKVNQYSDLVDVREDYLNAPIGTPIAMSDINTMWVWIPRFSATMTEEQSGEYTEGYCSDSTITGTFDCIVGGGIWTDAGYYNPGAFNITFVDTNTTAHDAFTFGTDPISGFWMGKFETTGRVSSACTSSSCNVSNVTILPNSAPLVDQTVSSFFYMSRSMEQSGNQYGFDKTKDTTLDTHMLKNNEWGAVAYLSQSIYGRCTSSTSCSEVGINNNSSRITGYGAPAGSSSSVTNGTYETALGMDASTTGNIYGVYDMSGGADEFVMGNYNNTIKNDQFTTLPNAKYYNVYTTESDYTNAGLQHALTETKNWYGDFSIFVSSYYPWFRRGGSSSFSSKSGVFFSDTDYGDASPSLGLHVSLKIN